MGRKRKNFEPKAPRIEEEKIIEDVPPLPQEVIDEHDRLDREFFDRLPLGYRFNPTCEELIEYLKNKASKSNMPLNRIREFNVYSLHPHHLTSRYKLHREKAWYFFTSRTKKYPNGKRPDRKAGNGFWKATGADVGVYDDEGIQIGTRKTLVYYEGKAKDKNATKTNWIMHEYRHQVNNTDSVGPVVERPQTNAKGMKLDDVVLCKIYYKASKEQVPNQNQDGVGADANSPMPASSPMPSSSLAQASSHMPSGYPLQASSQVQNQQVPNSNPSHSSTQDTLAAIFPIQNGVGQDPNALGFGNDRMSKSISELGPDVVGFDTRIRSIMPASSHRHASFPWQNQQVANLDTRQGLDVSHWLDTHGFDDLDLTSMPNPIQSLSFSQSFPPGNNQDIDLLNSLPNDTHSHSVWQEPVDVLQYLNNFWLDDPLECNHGQLPRLDDTIQRPDQALSSTKNKEG